MPDSTPSDLIESAGALVAAVDNLARKVRRSRLQIALLACSVVLDLGLSAGLLVAIDRSNTNQHRIERVVRSVERNANTLRTNCLAANESSDRQHQLWEGVLGLATQNTAPRTPEQQAREARNRAAFLALLEKTYFQRDCDKYLVKP